MSEETEGEPDKERAMYFYATLPYLYAPPVTGTISCTPARLALTMPLIPLIPITTVAPCQPTITTTSTKDWETVVGGASLYGRARSRALQQGGDMKLMALNPALWDPDDYVAALNALKERPDQIEQLVHDLLAHGLVVAPLDAAQAWAYTCEETYCASWLRYSEFKSMLAYLLPAEGIKEPLFVEAVALPRDAVEQLIESADTRPEYPATAQAIRTARYALDVASLSETLT